MLLTDTLNMTVNEIDRCLKMYPECYGGMEQQIKAVREVIDNLRNDMDLDGTVSMQEDLLRTVGKP